MCVLLCGLGDALPSAEELATGARANPDGYGWAVLFEGSDGLELVKGHTMDPGEACEALPALVGSLGSRVVAWLWHARIATSGRLDLSGCHPFDVGGDPLTVLGHNGILPLDPAPGLNDSATFARDILPAMGGAAALSSGSVCEIFEAWAKGSKLVVLSAAEGVEPVTILNESAGTWVEDVWFSNASCWSGAGSDPRTLGGWSWSSSTGAAAASAAVFSGRYVPDVGDDCACCGVPFDAEAVDFGSCSVCHACIDCGGWEGATGADACVCYLSPEYVDGLELEAVN